MNNTILSQSVLRTARKGMLVSFKATPYLVTRVSRKRDRVWLMPACTKFLPKWDAAKKEYVADIVRDVALPCLELSKRMIAAYDRKRC